ncbi:lipid droplet-associated protein [Amycolatopsis sp. 195334CR]|uniref:lipid droplet-associated protein n=1 Tax=Amycolatopsis sp. 195334CR TaxID=2814588 RepID=UPI001A8E3559|nr:lipid droplet-associated protein [Amycolatopsis sp. 195334CR]MBN6034559.1 lipid droplet-associated protein [Amycolatopsis sp. 195334CR]
MKPLPLPLRVAAGLAVETVERARELPRQLTGLPVTVASQVLQFSMRVQQHVTELAIKGDDVLSSLRPVEESPSWATFDEDLPEAPSRNGHRAEPAAAEAAAAKAGATATGATAAEAGAAEAEDPWAAEEQAIAEEAGPAGVTGYDELTLPQLRARLRKFSAAEVEELLAYERDHQNRPSFTGMLARRLGNLQQPGEGGQ